MNTLQHINNPEAFKEAIKHQMDQKAFGRLEDMKKEIANDFLKGGETK